jgi:orotate phosphoribosyltransferase
MELIPTQAEVIELLKQSGALREGFFKYPGNLYSNQYLQVAMAMTSYQTQKILSVALSRLVRQDTEIRAVIDRLSIVAPATGGICVAYSICEALRARRVYWAERFDATVDGKPGPMKFAQFLEVEPGEKVLLVDDRMRSGRAMQEMKTLVESRGGEVVGMAVLVNQPSPDCLNFAPIPLFYLAKLDAMFCNDEAACPIAPGQKPVEIWDSTA